jgi:acyl transferase domain-containing protein
MKKTLDTLTPMQKSAYALKKLRAKLDKLEKRQSEPVAIIGMSCRFPGALNCNEYWELLTTQKNAVTEIPEERWPINDFYDPDPTAPGKMNTRCGGFLSNIDMFDADFFNISLREAQKMDPQQRMLLEVTWEALENAGQAPGKLIESQTGVYIGFNQIDYGLMLLKRDYKHLDHYTTTGNGYCFGAGRIAYTFGFSGPVMAIDTACSSSMVALHQACNGLKANDCNIALVGGVQLNILPNFHILLSQTHTLSPSGACKTFDADADGLVLGEGCGVVVLKRLSDALSNNDHVLALITGTGINHGGPASGITVPNEIAQEKVIKQALKNARRKPSDIQFIETHGTGTAIGDPIEFNAIDAVFGNRPSEDPLILGSVKTNIGHLDAASGVAGLIKTVLSIQHNEIPPNLHFKTPSPKIDWSKGNIKVASENIQWSRGEKKRIAGVSSFGISGTNTHVIIEEPQESIETAEALNRPVHLFTLSAKNENALHDLAVSYCDYLKINPQEQIENICYTANTGRDHFKYRISAIVNSNTQLQEKLNAYINGINTKNLLLGEQSTRLLKITFYFPEESDQLIVRGKQLYDSQPIFKKGMDRCHKILQETYQISLNSIIHQDNDPLPENHIRLASFSIELALSEMWQSLGIKASHVMGHGVGDIAAACAAGKYTLEQAFELIIHDSLPDTSAKPQIKIISSRKSDIQNICSQHSQYLIELGLKSTAANNQANDFKYMSMFEENQDDWQTLLTNLSFFYIEGADIYWENLDQGFVRKRIHLPSYRFQRKRYWVSSAVMEEKSVNTNDTSVVAQKETLLSHPTQSARLTAQPVGSVLQDGQSSTSLSRIMANQLKMASDSVSKVVSQQLSFLSQGGTQQKQSVNKPLKPEVTPEKKVKLQDENTSGKDIKNRTEKNNTEREHRRKTDRPMAFLFPGVGDHYINMSKKLYDTMPVYRKQFDHCCDILKQHLEQDLRDIIFVKQEADNDQDSKGGLDLRRMLQRGPVDENTQKLNLPIFSHTGVFVVNYSLAKLWISWGIHPQATIGYSIGEYVSACLSEVISLEDVLPFIAKRAKMIQDLPEGAMLAVPLSEKEILQYLDESHSIAILSTDSQCVIAGTPEAIDNLEKTLTGKDILYRRLQNTHAVHSKLMEPLRSPITEMMQNIQLNPPKVPYLSNVTGTWINDAQATDPHYWAQHTCQTARFIDGIGELLQSPGRIMLEVGPGQSLGSFVYQHSDYKDNQDCIVLPTLKTMYDRQADDVFLLNTLGKLWLAGGINFLR